VSELEVSYVCAACGETIIVPVDVSAGLSQEYVEDCPVCCRPNLLHLAVAGSGRACVRVEAE